MDNMESSIPSLSMGYFDASHDLPEEILLAAGFIPYKILGNVHKSSDSADRYIFQTHCPAARSMLTEALENSDKWAGIIIAHGCDATNRQFDIWKKHVETPFLYWVNKPLKDDKTAFKFFKKEIRCFIEALEKQYNIEISDEKIKDAIKLSNELKSVLQKLGGLRTERDITNREYFEAVKKAVQDDKATVIKELEALLIDWKAKPEFPVNKKKVFLTGSDVTYVEWMDLMENSGLRVVRDDLSIGERYFATLIPEKEDPLDALVEYHFNIPRPATKHIPDKRLDFILRSIVETKTGIDGVVSQNLKFCETYAIDSVFIKKALNEKNIPNIHLERDYTGKSDEQMKNRLEAFSELI